MDLEFITCPVCAVQDTKLLFAKDGFSVVACDSCNLKYVNPRLRSNNLEENYINEYYPAIKRNHIQYNQMEWLQMEERLIEIQKRFPHQGRILDLGCGMGTFLYLAKKKGWETFGVDLSQDGIGFARENYNLNVFCGDVFEMDFPSHYFDVITLYHVLEHIPEPNPLLEELHRILKPKRGCLVVEVPNGESLQIRIQGENWPYVHPADHLYYFSVYTLANLLKKHRFNRVEVGKPKRVGRRNGMINQLKFAARYSISSMLVRCNLATVIRCYAAFTNN
ncbi:TPA: class I SAM-dependent methyltransferase [Candidatus Poribacteria bacterium]|jgi:2-polyprenyl-3-methyl-5-hydroxy-6-metoxy-1,4-benzoquinol methylase|nr:class I SAM-dependent methyltransferase [Candidatus Poribacteria bacterium]HIB86797.1 class I SAM-dependent methyltransferase [Candidatus Poribacteria bacterium]HIC01869.1 class I SAM-dependent methyltransferase [Candidatus Poribacteria bacterium]HIC16555.1 class I SAM-dependent methyltransferase [Candidatus Poribacteria bacterium]HIN31975.1 class I SAM-dependent methyltransferase [Candidatus Poribacteria bacterium]